MHRPLLCLSRQITQEVSLFGWEDVDMADSTAITTAVIASASALAGVLVSVFAQFWVSKYTFRLQERQTQKARLRSRYDELAFSAVRCRKAVVEFTKEARRRDYQTDFAHDRSLRQARDLAETCLSNYDEVMRLAFVDGATRAVNGTALDAYLELSGAIQELQGPRLDPQEYSQYVAAGGKVGPGGAFATAVDNLLEAIQHDDWLEELRRRGEQGKWRLFVNRLRR